MNLTDLIITLVAARQEFGNLDVMACDSSEWHDEPDIDIRDGKMWIS